MPTANKEFVLNYAMNRWRLNSKRNVGATSESIRSCNPSSFDDWTNYYFCNIRSQEDLNNLGRLLYFHISNDLPSETRFHPDLILSINENDCIEYMYTVVLERTYNGFLTERGSI